MFPIIQRYMKVEYLCLTDGAVKIARLRGGVMEKRCMMLGSFLLTALFATVQAQEYPVKPVRIVTGGAGGFNDIVSRHFASLLSTRWGQPVFVENRSGAGLTIGTAVAAQSAPDGYTLLVSDRTALAAAPTLNKSLPYDPSRDLAPITLVAKTPMILVGHASLPVADMRELIAYMRQQPQAIQFGSAGPATVPHVANEHFKHVLGVDVVSVHYKGSPALMMGLLAGEVRAAFMLVPTVMPHLKSGKVKAYAITSEKRFSGTPDIPTVVELGMPDLESQYWLAMLAPARTSHAIIQKVHRDVVEILNSAATREMLFLQGAEAAPGTPSDLARFIKSETAKWKNVIEFSGMRLD
jgi:tripartite-type tricarboxylate transporter receptor subunit TctC